MSTQPSSPVPTTIATTTPASSSTPATSSPPGSLPIVGFVGLGKIGYALARNIVRSGLVGGGVVAEERGHVYSSLHFDANPDVTRRFADETGSTAAASAEVVAARSDILFTALPNDKVLLSVTFGDEKPILDEGKGRSDQDQEEEEEEEETAVAVDGGGLNASLRPGSVHVSCSTISPVTSRTIARAHAERGIGYVSAPIFARPDGVAQRRATMPVSGDPLCVSRVRPYLLETATEVRDGFGSDPGAANVVKLAGNFLIASAIESMGEAYALAEGCGVDREAVHSFLSETIFDCLIYRGYGHRVAFRDHAPYPHAHFALDLGRKDVELIKSTASAAGVPMPTASLLGDRFESSVDKGRGDLDWSAVALGISEDAGVDVVAYEERCRREDPRLDWTPPT